MAYLGNAPTAVPLGSADLADNIITSAKIVDGTVTAGDLNATLNLGSKTVTLPATSVTDHVASEITKSASDPTGSTNPAGGIGTVFLNTTSGEMYSLTDATAGANVWTNTGDGTGRKPYTSTVATGGTITTDGNFKVHTFTTSGTFAFTVTTLGTDTLADYLVIAGGGAGGSKYGGGGGAGGYRNSFNSETSGGGGSSETGITMSVQAYTVVVGAGGASVTSADGTLGSDSTFGAITSLGGGGGGQRVGSGSTTPGSTGGSGGGAGDNFPSTTVSGSAGTANQGFAGGGSIYVPHFGSGGGGAGAVGFDSDHASFPSIGGVGVTSAISGSSIMRAGGGGGGDASAGTGAIGGEGGGGDGASPAPAGGGTGTVNTGSGGGGAGDGAAPNSTSGAGGSGVVIIRYQFQ